MNERILRIAANIVSMSLAAAFITACAGESESRDPGPDRNTVPTTALAIKGILENGDTPTNTAVLASQDVSIKSLSGETIASAQTDASGGYQINVPAGALAINPKASALGPIDAGSTSLVSTQYSLVSSVPNKCWDGSAADPGTPTTGVITITSLAQSSYTGASCLSRSTASGASAVTLNEIQVLSDGAIYVIHKIISTSVLEKRLWRVIGYTNNQITIDFDSGFELMTRQ